MGDKIRLALDAQSGDFGADVIVRGVMAARKAADVPFVTYLCGDEADINRVLNDIEKEGGEFDRAEFIIEHCPDVITDADKRTTVWKNKRASSIVRCVTLQEEGTVDVTVSAGDTGILIGTALFILGRKEGALRPVLGAFVPTPLKSVLILDVGANVDCKAEHLANFAQLGLEYVERVSGRDDLKVALLNIGTEPSKGPPVVREAAQLLESCKNYAGFIEGNKVFSGEADIVVCDGFAGNVLLKTSESFYSLLAGYLKGSRETLEKLFSQIDVLNPENYGAVPFLGINGTVLKAHGASSVRQIKNAVLRSVNAPLVRAV